MTGEHGNRKSGWSSGWILRRLDQSLSLEALAAHFIGPAIKPDPSKIEVLPSGHLAPKPRHHGRSTGRRRRGRG